MTRLRVVLSRLLGSIRDFRAGGKWRCTGVGMDGGRFEVSGEYLEINEPHLLVSTWVASWTGDAKTIVRWELDPTDRGTLVRIRHRGLARRPELTKSYSGWPRMLGWLRVFLESGENVASRTSASTSP